MQARGKGLHGDVFVDGWRRHVEDEVGLHSREGRAEIAVDGTLGECALCDRALAVLRTRLDAGDHVDIPLFPALVEPIAAPAAQPYEYGFHWRPFSLAFSK